MITSNMEFHDPNHAFERGFWGNCVNTYFEERKQWVYAEMMRLPMHNCAIIADGKRILDIGGGPVSMLLKCHGLKQGVVVDPIAYPDWVKQRYEAANIRYIQMNAEDISGSGFDEVWMYNVLQHCVDPERIIANAKRSAPVFRVFEWLDFPPHAGHPHMLTQEAMDRWIGGTGHVEYLNKEGCYGNSYSGCFLVG